MSPKVTYRLWSAAELIGDSIAMGIERCVDRITRPKTDPTLEFLMHAAPLAQQIINAITPKIPADTSGPGVRQLRREFAAEEARLSAEVAEKRARLVADFGPRFDKAHRIDEIDLVTREGVDRGSAESIK